MVDKFEQEKGLLDTWNVYLSFGIGSIDNCILRHKGTHQNLRTLKLERGESPRLTNEGLEAVADTLTELIVIDYSGNCPKCMLHNLWNLRTLTLYETGFVGCAQ